MMMMSMAQKNWYLERSQASEKALCNLVLRAQGVSGDQKVKTEFYMRVAGEICELLMVDYKEEDRLSHKEGREFLWCTWSAWEDLRKGGSDADLWDDFNLQLREAAGYLAEFAPDIWGGSDICKAVRTLAEKLIPAAFIR